MRGAKKNKEGREKPGPDVTTNPPTTESKFRINLPLLQFTPHTLFICNTLLQAALMYKFRWMIIFSPQINTQTLRTSALKHRQVLTEFMDTHIIVYTLSLAKNKDINTTKCLWGSTQGSFHIQRSLGFSERTIAGSLVSPSSLCWFSSVHMRLYIIQLQRAVVSKDKHLLFSPLSRFLPRAACLIFSVFCLKPFMTPQSLGGGYRRHRDSTV